MVRRMAPAGKALGAALLAAACVASPPAPVAIDWSKAQTVAVDLVDYRFVPDRLVFRRGVAYRLHLENKGAEQHEFTAPEFLKAVEVRNPEVVGTYGTEIVLQPGEKKDLLFLARQPGTFKLICSDHDWAGMIGQIAVE
ncbi:MAG TPA: cupredoxin domain-containing protein [Stellaceae bacterium]|jgi:uncharacterized cupredoxin-like copper-binding protein|nr:cupredoxin domain-containing protein [Stellaceae bacterium]